MNHLFFCYGTLKKGFSRHYALQNQIYLGTATSLPNYFMFRVADFPGVIKSDPGINILGELYEVSEECMSKLDEIEGVNQGGFDRGIIKLENYVLSNLPQSRLVFESLNNKEAVCYFIRERIPGAKDCQGFWGK